MELRGTLKDFSLADVIQLVAFGQKTGVLEIHWEGGKAALYFENGHVVHAEAPGHTGEEAVFTLFGMAEGEFRFRSGERAPARTITLDPTNLVMEAARRLDEADRGPGGQEDPFEVDFLGFEVPERDPALDPAEVREEIKQLLRQRFGRRAKRMIQAVDRCGDSLEDFLDLADRVEKYVRIFLDEAQASPVATAIREIAEGGAPSDSPSF